jgi:hypothetical protein
MAMSESVTLDHELPPELEKFNKADLRTKHVLDEQFFDARQKSKDSSFTIGFHLKENMENFDFQTLF